MLGMSSINRKPRQFSHKPIYFSPENETQEQKDIIASKEKDSDYVMGKHIQKQRRNRMLGLDRPQTSTVDKRKVLTRLIIGVCLLCVIAYMIIKSDVLLMVIEMK